MGDDFDPEAYLEATLEGRLQNGDKSSKRNRDDDDSYRGGKRSREEEGYKERRFTEEKRSSSRSSRPDRDRERERSPRRSRSPPPRRSRSPYGSRRSPSYRRRSPRRSRSPRRGFPGPPPRHYNDDFRGGGYGYRGRGRGGYGRPDDRDKKPIDDGKTDAERERERELMELERDSRTVFVYHLSVKSDEKRIMDFFNTAGKVRDVRLITDRNTRKSKGFGYIEFYEKESVPRALLLSGQILDGQAVMVKASEAEKNFQASTASTAMPVVNTVGPTRLYVGSLHFNVTEEDLKSVFGPFGELEFIQIHMDPETGRSKGFGFVQYKRADDAKRALNQLNGLEVAGRQLKVGLVNETKPEAPVLPIQGGSLGELDDDEGGGLQLNAQSRALLMAKLQRGAMASSVPVPIANPSLPLGMSFGVSMNSLAASMQPGMSLGGVPLGSGGLGGPGLMGMMAPQQAPPPTPFVLLKNMFDYATAQSTPNFEEDIKEDVEEEARKYGTVLHIYVDKNSQGHVYLKYVSVDQARAAISTFNHRWFAGKMISAEHLAESTYRNRFPEAFR